MPHHPGARYHTGFERFGAAFADNIVLLPLGLANFFARDSIQDHNLAVLWLILYSLCITGYSVFMHYRYGQTLGKMFMGVRVVDLSETRGISLKQAIMRDSVAILLQFAVLIYIITRTEESFAEAPMIFTKYKMFNDIPMSLWMILELITMLSNNKRRAIHDFLAGTVVVKTGKIR